MAKTFPPIPPHDDLVDLMLASASNARDLLADAEFLLAKERAPRAYALAVLALEEAGKTHLCMVAMLRGFVDNETFWKLFSSHDGKLRAASIPAVLTGVIPDESALAVFAAIKGGARAGHELKMSGLYVDFRDGKVKRPDAITAEEAQQAIEAAKVAVVPLEGYSDPEAGARLRHVPAVFERLGLTADVLKSAVAADPDAFLRFSRQMHGADLSAWENFDPGSVIGS